MASSKNHVAIEIGLKLQHSLETLNFIKKHVMNIEEILEQDRENRRKSIELEKGWRETKDTV